MVRKSKKITPESSDDSARSSDDSARSSDDSARSSESSYSSESSESSEFSESCEYESSDCSDSSKNMVIDDSASDSKNMDDNIFNKNDEELHHNNKKKYKKKFNIKFYIDKNIKKKKKNIKKNNKYAEIIKKYNLHEKKYFKNLDLIKKEEIYDKETLLSDNNLTNYNEPLRFKFLNLNIPNISKNIILSKLEQLNDMSPGSSDYYKLKNWINILDKIPLGKYHTLPIVNNNNVDEVSCYLQSVKNTIDSNVYGHIEAKEQIIRILAQWISYPNANGYVIGIKGAMGIGKTKLVKEGICDALKFPFAFISLGGISDASYLKGHSYTYEGSTYGKIVECLIKSKVMNPVLFFDELDKVSSTDKGEEIINTLIHLTDPTQNKNFTDRYFEEIDLDLSKSIIIFTYNNENLLNPILKDRMITINVNGYTLKEKITISKNYLIKEILQEYNIQESDIIFDDNIIKYIIENTIEEEGVRNLKRNINNIISWVNVMRYIPHNDIKLKFPFEINTEFIDKFIKKYNKSFIKEVHHSMYT